MLNYNGLMYRLTHTGGALIVLGLITLILRIYLDQCYKRKIIQRDGIKENRENRKKNRKDIFLWAGVIVLGLIYCGSYINKIQNPQVAEFVGTFCYDYRDSGAAPPFPYTLAYIFLPEVNDGFHKDEFYLDVATEKEIIPERFEEGQLYRIYYEESCKVILGVDVLSSDKE